MPAPTPTLTATPEPFLIKMVADGGNFWDSPFVGVLGALVGVAIGALLTFWLGWLQDARTAKRDLSRRYLDEIKTSSAHIVRAAADVIFHLIEWESLLAQDSFAQRRNSTQDALDKYPDVLIKGWDAIRQSSYEYQLIAPANLRDLASAMEEAARQATYADNDIEKVRAAKAVLTEATDNLRTAVRDVLGVPGTKKGGPENAPPE